MIDSVGWQGSTNKPRIWINNDSWQWFEPNLHQSREPQFNEGLIIWLSPVRKYSQWYRHWTLGEPSNYTSPTNAYCRLSITFLTPVLRRDSATCPLSQSSFSYKHSHYIMVSAICLGTALLASSMPFVVLCPWSPFYKLRFPIAQL